MRTVYKRHGVRNDLDCVSNRFAKTGQWISSIAAVIVVFSTWCRAADRYWDTSAGAANGVGGSGTWGTTFSTTASGDDVLTTAGVSDDVIFQGVPGVITLPNGQSASSFAFNVSGYRVTGSDQFLKAFSGDIVLASDVNVIIGNGLTTDIAIGVANVSGAAGSHLTIDATATGDELTLLRIRGIPNPTVSVPIVITGTGFANIVGDATAAVMANTVTGNGSRLNVGGAGTATVVTFTNTINNGTGAFRFTAGSGGGAGIVTIASTGNVWGDTELNSAPGGILRLGITDALPTGTTMRFGATINDGDSTFDMRSFSQTIGQLTSGPQSGGTITNGIASTTSVLTISGSNTSAPAFRGMIRDGNGTVALVRAGTGWTTLGTLSTYTGGTSVDGGKLIVNNTTGSGTGTGSVNVNTGGTIGGNGAIAGATYINSGGTLAPGNSIGRLTFLGAGTNVTMADDSTYEVELAAPTTPGTTFDQVLLADISKTFTPGGATLKLVSFPGIATGGTDTYQIVSALSGATMAAGSFFQNLDGTPMNDELATYTQGFLSFTINYESEFISLTFSAVPEPALVGLGLLPPLFTRRRSRR